MRGWCCRAWGWCRTVFYVRSRLRTGLLLWPWLLRSWLFLRPWLLLDGPLWFHGTLLLLYLLVVLLLHSGIVLLLLNGGIVLFLDLPLLLLLDLCIVLLLLLYRSVMLLFLDLPLLLLLQLHVVLLLCGDVVDAWTVHFSRPVLDRSRCGVSGDGLMIRGRRFGDMGLGG